jgi:alcohol dehydrogenase class IV
VQNLNIPPLSAYGLVPQDIEESVDQSARASSMQGNPIKLEKEELFEILERAM